MTGLESGLRSLAAASGKLHDDSDGAITQFDIGGIQISHEVAGNFSQPDHGQSGEHVQEEFGGGTGFEAGRTGQHFGADVYGDQHIRALVGWKLKARVEGDQHGGRPGLASLAQGRSNKRSSAAGGDANNNIAGTHTPTSDFASAGGHIVLRAFD